MMIVRPSAEEWDFKAFLQKPPETSFTSGFVSAKFSPGLWIADA
jgi:hypothetical protein